MEEPGIMSIQAQHIRQEIPADSFNRRSSMNIESELIEENYISISNEPNIVVREIFPSEASVQSQLVEAQAIEPEMVIETEVIENLPFPIALTQPVISKANVLKKISDTKTPKQFLRSAPKPIPVLLQQTITSAQSLEK